LLAVVATDSAETNRQIYREAQGRGVLCNVVDDPEHCDFYYPAVVRRGALQIAISTGGLSPALAQRLRLELEAQFGAEFETWLNHLGAIRRNLFTADMQPEERHRRLHRLASRAGWQDYVQQRRTSNDER
jgi:precorrin-2 dehydrogenase/sirohydrochlorin ferrochelatase